MSEQSFEELLNENFKTIHTGEIVDGKVIDVKEDEIVLNIGYKSDGIVTRNEYSSDSNVDLRDVAKVGDEMKTKVIKVNDGDGQVLLSYRRMIADAGSKKIEEAFENQTIITAKVTQIMNGGLGVNVDETRVFIPASLVSDSYIKDLSVFKDKDVTFVITEYNPRKRRTIGDCKQLILKDKEVKKKQLLEELEEGKTVEGTVKNVTDFGAFVDLGGIDGLLHISEMSWGRMDNPRKIYKIGDTVKAFIKEIDGEKIALSVKYPELNPWNGAEEKYAVGNVVKGKVARMTDFGAFIQLEDGIDALLHVSQISKDHVEKPADVLSIGQEVETKVVDFNPADKKISLSMKALVSDSAESSDDE